MDGGYGYDGADDACAAFAIYEYILPPTALVLLGGGGGSQFTATPELLLFVNQVITRVTNHCQEHKQPQRMVA